MTPDAAFRNEYGGSRNFMTPELIERGWITRGSIAYELSEGAGIFSPRLYGVTFVRILADQRTERLLDMSGCETTIEAARERIEAAKAVTK